MGSIGEKSGITEDPRVIHCVQDSGNKKKKVAAYCRVSKNIEEQETSIQVQMASYDRIICEHEDWELAGIYADKGRTGTGKSKRPAFNRMIQDAKMGKIDMILAKSASRFARNTVDLLQTTRELRDLGVGVFFEKEKIDTLSLQSEMLLTIFAAFAQEESRSISENMKRGIRQRFEIGIPKFTAIYGLKRSGKDDWDIVAEEAEVVRRMFELTLKGISAEKIADHLNEQGIPGPNHTGKTNRWYGKTVCEMLRNEKYMGDCRMQKYYTADHLSHQVIRNNRGIVRQFYAEDHHPAIVSKEIYQEANTVILMRDCHRGSVQYPYYGKLLCPYCGKPMVKVMLPSGRIPAGWVCGGEGEGKTYTDRTNCPPYWCKEPFLTQSVRRAILALDPSGLERDNAKAVAEVQGELKERAAVTYMDLKRLVKSMTFPDWDTLEITWIWGDQRRTGYRPKNPIDYPNPEMRWEKEGCKIGPFTVSHNNVPNMERALAKIIAWIKQVQIIPDTDKGFPVPPIVMKPKDSQRKEQS